MNPLATATKGVEEVVAKYPEHQNRPEADREIYPQ